MSKKIPPMRSIPPIIAMFLGISSGVRFISTFVQCDCAVEHATHASDTASKCVVERGRDTDDDATDSSKVEGVVLNIDHREVFIYKAKLTKLRLVCILTLKWISIGKFDLYNPGKQRI
jgi:hypothetical protein